jgi:homopolymeric O-antigen transport system ATP-binding protein
MRPIIEVRGLGKSYTIGRRRNNNQTLREAIVSACGAPLKAWQGRRNEHRAEAAPSATLWALRDVSFDVMPGEVMGIVGKNGAGKSTLLKILARITEPTLGSAHLYGRVGSLLEVGTGFHSELSGRENIFLSGAILGMRRAEIKRKFDEIVAFAGVDEFIDTPVKRYSSGMHVRLAFAVAAHLETEILLVDEVLAVGDAAFQKRCLGKMGDVAREGRTILFVSHSMATVEALCQTCLYIARGRSVTKSSPSEAISHYMTSDLEAGAGQRSLVIHQGRRNGQETVMSSISLYSRGSEPTGMVRMGEPLSVRVSYSAPRPVRPVLGIAIKTVHGSPVFCVSDRFAHQLAHCKPAARATVACEIEELALLPGTYSLDLWLGDETSDFDMIQDAISFEVIPADLLGTGRLPPSVLGAVFCRANWRLLADQAVELTNHDAA